jgi:hypothetical protein
MPPSVVPEAEMTVLLKFLRSIQQRPLDKPVERKKVQTTDGRTIEGQILGEGFDDLASLGRPDAFECFDGSQFGSFSINSVSRSHFWMRFPFIDANCASHFRMLS